MGGAGHGLEELQVQLHMVDFNETLWEIDEHTKAKHTILDKYLKAWFPILSKKSSTLVYIDGFAGPGEYKGGEPGSPIIALKAALEHKHKDKFKKIAFWFIECRDDRCEHLRNKIASLGDLPSNFHVEVTCGRFDEELSKILDELEREGASLNPTFCFVDPFGYTETGGPKILGKILKFPKCEVLLTYMVGFMDRGAYDPDKCKTICREWDFSEEDINKIINTKSMESREMQWIDALKNKLIKASGSDLRHLAFCVKGYNNRTLYYLVYFTKHIKGIEVMKEAMFKTGKTGQYKFSDYNFKQTNLLDYSNELWQNECADIIYEHFRGSIQKTEDVKNWVILETPYIWRSGILIKLEEEGKITRVIGRPRRFTYPDNAYIEFK
ncbi:MAG: three-Cys-motif partner protein TcmP [Candidatus Methanomethyliales bacterium]|nr:three-Cys-motif partner protein TcmP [Candidatus Methanomethylicales archaeon]